MRRSLVLGDESALHPFRQSLPPHVCGPSPIQEDQALAHASAQEGVARAAGWFSAQDARDFLLAYCACFVAVMAFVI